MRVGLMLPPGLDPAEVPATAARAEEQGFDLVACGEHVLFGSPTANAFVSLAAAAAATEHVRLLSAVTLLPLYPAPLAAKMAATLDRLSRGRFEMGIGVGGEYPAEFAACGVDLAGRGRRTDASLDVLTRLLAGEPADAPGPLSPDGTAVALDPLPVQRPRPPIWIGGRSEASMRRAGRGGDVWMPYLCSPARITRGLATAREEAALRGRAPTAVSGAYFAWCAVDPDPARARATALTTLTGVYGQDMERIADACVPTGDAAGLVARLDAYRAAGAEHLVLVPACAPDQAPAMVERLARDVVPRLSGT